nr:hypothetical protein [Tanacetum cinerariifolium]
MAPKKRTTGATPATVTTHTTTITDAQLQALIDQGVAATLAERDANMSRNAYEFPRHRRSRWAIGQDVAYAMLWAALKRMITDKYCPRGEIHKLESEYWNLKVKGVDLLNYNHRFQELALIVKASKPQSMQEAIEFATEMLDKKMTTHA